MIMESANLHHHLHLLHSTSSSSSSSCSSLSSTSTPSWYVASPSTNHHNQHHANWNNTSNNFNEENQYNKRNDSRHEQNDILVPPPSISNNTTSSMIQDIGFQYWNNNTNPTANYINPTSNNEADCSYPKLTEMMMMNNQDPHFNSNQIINEKLFLKTLSSSAFQDQFEFDNHGQNMNCSGFGGSLLSNNVPSRGSFSQIFPTINISNLSSGTNTTSDHISSSMNMNLEALDLLTSARFTGNFNEHSLGLVEEILPYAHHHQMSQPVMHRPPISPNYHKISSSPAFMNGEAIKRASNTLMDSKSSQAEAPTKKSRSETRACPPFKVRKEKLGDRIAALQQLVAPFGKTDTASVLMEAIGYIKFLQNQVETLSVPYMKSSSRNKTHRAPLHAQSQGDINEDPNRDLKSRGLCLVPLSCMSYITTDSNGGGGSCGGGIWPHAEYHGCT